MRELRLGIWLVTAAWLAALGCDDGGRAPDGGVADSGPGSDTGTPADAGPRPDSGGGGGRCGPAGACDITTPTSCGAGQACVLQGGSTMGWTTVCIAAGAGLNGSPCDQSAPGQCAEGFACSDEGVCRRWCCNVGDCPAGMICNIYAGAGPEGYEVGLCRLPDTCNPVDQTGCDPGEACNLLGSETVCDTPGTATEGMPCMSRNGCVAGYACAGMEGGEHVCRKYCDMSATEPCPADFMCIALTGAPAGVGVCIPTSDP